MRGGPGEKQIELDRRMLETRRQAPAPDLARLTRQRQLRRRGRERGGIPAVALVGYTNAGKSTLFNAMTGAGAYAADQLFATLDTLTRRVQLAPGAAYTLSDTVGFVRDLPHSLVEAFRATLEETARADLLIHVIDAASPEREQCVAAVTTVLAEIGAADVPVIEVVNKIDLAGLSPGVDRDACGTIRRVYVSASSGDGIADLSRVLGELLFGRTPTESADPVGWRSAA